MARRPGGSPRGSYDLGRRARKHAGGKGPCLDQAGQEVRARACRRRPTPPLKKYDNSKASYRCVPSGVGHGGSLRFMTGSIGVTSCGKHGDECAAILARRESTRRRSRRWNHEAWESFWRKSRRRGGQADIVLPGEAAIPTESRGEAAALGDTD